MPATIPTSQDHQRKKDRDALMAIALLTYGDWEDARSLWEKHAAPAFIGLTDGNGFTWNDATQSYQTTHGRNIKADDMKRLALSFALAVEFDLQSAARIAAKDPLHKADQFGQDAARIIKAEYEAEAAIAVGGFSKITPAILQSIQGDVTQIPSLAFSIDRLSSFVEEMKNATAGTEAQIVARSALYGASGNGIYELARMASHANALDSKGRRTFLYYRNLLGVADHCRSTDFAEGCPDVTAAGFQLIGTLPEIGDRSCGPNCKCSWDFSLVGPASSAISEN